jgi:hypothetical protein
LTAEVDIFLPMLLRSGLIVGEADEAEGSSMDNLSIQAESTQPESSQAESIQPDSSQPESSQHESTRAELGSPHISRFVGVPPMGRFIT